MSDGGADRGPEPEPQLVGVSAFPPPHSESMEQPPTPRLPSAPPKPPVPLGSPPVSPGAAAKSAWYRSDQQRYRSVHRRANPWYRRLARGTVGLALLAILGAGLYFGVRALQDHLGRDQLPSPGQGAAEFASTSFLVKSTAPAPAVDGTFTIDTATSAFEFVGSPGGPQAGFDVVSPDGSRLYVRTDLGEWRTADAGDARVAAVTGALPYLLGVGDADDVLENRLRKEGLVTLDDQTSEGTGSDELERYEMTLDTLDYSAAYPLQWDAYRSDVVPAMAEGAAVPLTMWIDDDNVVVRLRDANWSWERLAYSDVPFAPVDPAGR
jgi:hypothetical protein